MSGVSGASAVAPAAGELDAGAREVWAGRPEVLLVAGLAWSAGLIHLQAALDHLDEYWPYAACFALLSVLQVGWGVAAWRRPSRRLLVAGIAGSLAVIAVWVLSRTVGLPLGPDARAPEAAGVLDVLATLDEVAIVALCGVLWGDVQARAGLRVMRLASLLVIFASSLVLGGGLHAH